LRETEALLVTLGGSVKTEAERQKAIPAKRLKLKTEGPSLLSPSSLQPTALSLSQSSVLSAQSLFSPAMFCHEGEYWTLAFEGVVCRLRDTRGLHYIAQLLQYPHQEFRAIDLTRNVVSSGEMSTAAQSVGYDANVPRIRDELADAGEALDPQARAAYRQRISDLQTELVEADAFNDLGRIEKIREEIDFLTQELAQAIGLGGRARRVGSPTERARVTVTKAIRTVLARITETHPALGQYLTLTLRTGTECVYRPDARQPVTWQF
jgi:hypothetical protein